MIATSLSAFEDRALASLTTGVLTLLVLASAIGWILDRRITSGTGRATVQNINARIRAWWVMCAVFAVALASAACSGFKSPRRPLWPPWLLF